MLKFQYRYSLRDFISSRQGFVHILLSLALILAGFVTGFLIGKKTSDTTNDSQVTLEEILTKELAESRNKVGKKKAAAEVPRYDFFSKLTKVPKKTVTRDRPKEAVPPGKIATNTDLGKTAPKKIAKGDNLIPVRHAKDKKDKRYTLQVASFRDQSQADSMRLDLRSQGIKSKVVPSEIAGKGRWYRVQLGPYSSLKAAESEANRLESLIGVKSLVRRLDK